MQYSIIKQAIQESDRDTVEKVLAKKNGEDILEAAIACGVQVNDIDEAYQGQFDSDEAFAKDEADQLGESNEDDSRRWPHDCIDWEQAARGLMEDYCEDSGHYFRSM